MRTSVQCTNNYRKGAFEIARKKSSRKYQLTINNPSDKGYNHETIKLIMEQFSLVYWCMCDEIGKEGTYHTHIFFIAKNGVMFDTVQNRFYGAHIEAVKGSNKENYNYIRKIGEKYADKQETNLSDTFEEFGSLPADRSACNSLNSEIFEMIENGSSDYEILTTYPNSYKSLEAIRKARQVLEEEKVKNQFRKMQVYYYWGKTGSGKTRTIMEKHGYENVYRITNYEHPFDNYNGQKVILFDEFRSSLKIADMLTYLDGYPIMLPCRYSNKVALFDTVYLATNIPIDKQYENVQIYEPETYKAFLRRINEVKEIKKNTENTNCVSDEFISID